MPPARRLVVLATIGAPHGVKGEVRVKSFTTDPMALGAYGPLFAEDGRAFDIERLRASKGNTVVAKFRGIDDRDTAAALNGVNLYAERERLPPTEAEEYYYADLIGLAAFDAASAPLGTVVAVQNFGAGDILEIAPGRGPSLMVPFTKACAPDIDIAARRLVVVPPKEVEIEEEK